MRKEIIGLLLGFIAVAGFSLTPPATRAAVMHLDPWFVVCARAVLAAAFAGVLLVLFKQAWPPRRVYASLFTVACCVVILFPLLLTLALQTVPAAHAGVMLGVLPLITTIVAMFRCNEIPSPWFWAASALGAISVCAFALMKGQGSISAADWLLVLAVIAAAIGYAEGARLGLSIGSWQTICWALLFSAPALLVALVVSAWNTEIEAPVSAWMGIMYIGLISQLLAFFPWYQAMAIAGTAKVSQLMLLMPFMTIAFSNGLLDEHIDSTTLFFAAAIVLSVALSWRLTVKRNAFPWQATKS